jgi:hypothetical protein
MPEIDFCRDLRKPLSLWRLTSSFSPGGESTDRSTGEKIIESSFIIVLDST